jgi:hypothetical protein
MKKFLVLGMFVALLAVLVTPMAVFATADPSTTPVSGSIAGPTIDIQAPGAIAFGILGQSQVKETSLYGSVTVTPGSDGTAAYTVTAKDTTGGGYMWSGTPYASTNLVTKCQISQHPDWGFANADTGITYSGTGTSATLDLYASQIVTASDTTIGVYSITITFTGSATP